jgi:aldehyde dehydrogenase (NAD+)
MFIGGAWVAAQSGDTIPVISPVDGIQYDTISRGGAHEVDLAVQAAHKALQGAWGKLTATERGRIMLRIAEKVLENQDELSRLEAKDTGKPMTTARNDIVVLARYFEFYGGAADKVHGQIIPFLNDYTVMLMREPHGVTGHIIPWNYPAQMLGRTLAPALAMGNAAVLKPAEDTSLSALKFAELAADAGLPEGALNVVTGLGEEAGAALTSHPGINFLTFTGSNEVGTLVQEAAARNAVKCVLELGGNSPQIVFGDADLERALPIVIRAIVQNAGQTCTAGSRLLIQRNIYDDFIVRVGTHSAPRKSAPRIWTWIAGH